MILKISKLKINFATHVRIIDGISIYRIKLKIHPIIIFEMSIKRQERNVKNKQFMQGCINH